MAKTPPQRMRFRSVRACRELATWAAREAQKGEMTTQDMQRFVEAAQKIATMVMAEKQLQLEGILDVLDDDHPLGSDGGVGDLPRSRPARKKRVTARSGFDRNGRRVDEQTVTIEQQGGSAGEGGEQAELQDMVTDAEVENL